MNESQGSPGRPMVVLVVEDSPTQAVMVRRFFASKGHEVVVAHNGVEGLARAREIKPHLIVSDIAMPGMDGFGLCREVKNDPELRHTTVLLLTMLSDAKEIIRGLNAGADHYMVKPYDEQHLVARLSAFLQDTLVDRCQEVDDRLEVHFAGETHLVQAGRQQIMNLLLSTYENAFQQNAELIQTQFELKRLNETLANQANERQNQLVKELETVNQELKEFAYIVSHDLKAPLRSIDALVQWITEDYGELFDETGREQLDLLIGRVRRMQSLIEGVLNYSRIGRVREEIESVNLNRLVASVIDLLSPPNNISIHVAGRLPTVKAEKTRISQVFQNLFSNAIKFMDKEMGSIQLSCEQEGDEWHFMVTDNGPGIPEKDFERIFQIFQTLNSRDSFESTGVGLTLVKKIVELHGGRVWVTSRLTEGSTFHFTLPVVITHSVE
ncbi:MAG: response regulator [Magnetococcales bacterium]|nr:response regulator [Magnetococcales bacterium]